MTLNKWEAKQQVGKGNKETGNDQALPVFWESKVKWIRNLLKRVGQRKWQESDAHKGLMAPPELGVGGDSAKGKSEMTHTHPSMTVVIFVNIFPKI